MIRTKLTVYFEDPFWVGLFEFQAGETYYADRRVFGAEPTDREVSLFVLRYLPEFRVPVNAGISPEREIGAKRRQRLAAKELAARGPGTKALDAVKLQRETSKKLANEEASRQKKEDFDAEYLRRKEKRRDKHKGH
jgi:hypothetical protein